MKENFECAALFDFDGVVMDTESQYSEFWAAMGRAYHPQVDGFDRLIKGQTLQQIFEGHFAGTLEAVRPSIVDRLNAFEAQMQYNYIPGVVDFVGRLRSHGVRCAVVTSSNELKMQHVRRAHPEIERLFDRILTADMFTRSKPHPDCFLLGAEVFQVLPEHCVVFEDSFHGLEAARRAGMHVIGLATTNPRALITGKADFVIDDFSGMNVEKMYEICGFIR